MRVEGGGALQDTNNPHQQRDYPAGGRGGVPAHTTIKQEFLLGQRRFWFLVQKPVNFDKQE